MALAPSPVSPTNAPEFTVSELSQSLRRTVEDAYGRVRVRGELSGVKRPASGHVYACLKDAGAALDLCIWKLSAARLGFRPEDGLEVIATGKLSTNGERSKYQLIVDRLEPAGVGALLAQLERRKAMLAAEGLFADTRKRALPYLPDTIGVITSPTGAVIRDILHRLADRFPRRVLVWPVAVQGETAAAQVAAAIRGFNAASGALRPDLLIVARGGGSIEDLWPFNDEALARAVAASAIPLISAVGHETDTTLCDLAADRRAPTPTAAAEMAVPVRAELMANVAGLGARQARCAARHLERARERLAAVTARLPAPAALTSARAARGADLSVRLPRALATAARTAALRRDRVARALVPALLARRHTTASRDLADECARLGVAVRARLTLADRARDRALQPLRPALVTDRHAAAARALAGREQRIAAALAARLAAATRARGRAADPLRLALVTARARTATAAVGASGRMLASLSPLATLGRGYAIIERDGEGGGGGGGGHVLASAAAASTAGAVALRFHDGRVAADIRTAAVPAPPGGGQRKPMRPRTARPPADAIVPRPTPQDLLL